MPYSIVEPGNFTEEHQSFIDQFAQTIEIASSRSALIAGAKDVRSCHLTASDRYGRTVGLSRGKEVSGRMDRDMPCEGTAAFADCYVREDRRLLEAGDTGALKSVLNIHRYKTGSSALVFDKFLLNHHPSRSVLGIVYCAYETDLDRFVSLFPDYWAQFGFGCSIERAEGEIVDGVGRLSEIEYEIAFLLALGLDTKAIVGFFRRLRPSRVADVGTSLFSIADKMAAAGVAVASIRDRLILARVHQRIPASFFARVTRSHT